MKRSRLAAIWALTVVISIGISVLIAPERAGAETASVRPTWYYLRPADDGSVIRAHRALVPGGWLVAREGAGGGVTFVPDPNHEWR